MTRQAMATSTWSRNLRIASLLSAVLLMACNSKLSSAEAERVISANPKALEIGSVRVEAVSQADGSNEAIARVALGDTKLNAKLRQYDKGWEWEFVETTAGTWLPPERVIAELSEQQRLKRATAWANERAAQYQQTIAAMDAYSGNLPRPPEAAFNIIEWDKRRKMSASAYRNIAPSAERTKTAESLESPAVDAWGNEVLLNFDSSTRTATFVSMGPDKQKGTPDDVICVSKGYRNWDDFYDKVLWDYRKTWRVPEGLQGAIDRAVEEPEDRKAEFSRVVE